MDSKSFLLSKTFWVNVAGLAITVGGILPAKVGPIVIMVANLLLRAVTDQPLHIFPPEKSG